jgi:mannose/cellobiose epimerase-like protein (N-acyl-D-glucosamine 2-epimerase family)
VALRTTLEQSYAHPLGGFVEDLAGTLPQRANPHMHLLEAALAWISIDDDPAWRRLADGLAALCLQKFVDPASGALRELFARDWSPAAGVEGRICEPGHHYEWAFLLDRWARLTSRNKPEAVARIIAFADSHRVDARRGVAVNAVLVDGSIHDPVARLWAQAERVRAYLAHRHSDKQIAAAIMGLRRFLATPTPGVWFDQLMPDDIFVSAPARAIVGAVADLSAEGSDAACNAAKSTCAL